MRDLAGFRQAVLEYRRTAARTQRQMARAIGLHPDVLSHKLNGSDHAVLTTTDVTGIVTTLAQWAALRTRAEAEQLLELMDVPTHALSADDWARPPLAHLVDDRPAGPPLPRAQSDQGHRTAAPPASGPSSPSAPTTIPRLGEQHLDPAAPPVPTTPLIGRTCELQAIHDALTVSRLVTLTGAGGTGKTRLAVHTALEQAEANPGGVAFADLAPVPDPGLLAIAVARSLGLRPSSAGTAEDALIRALLDRPVLLVLDNLEHLLDATPMLTKLLAAAPETRILATSRIPLRLYGEAVLRVPPLGLEHADGPEASEAVQLFLQRARAAGAQFSPVGENLTAVSQICAALDGLPLAIELAAARIRLYSPPALLARLGDRMSLLTRGPRDLPRRQQTLHATLDWSHALLDQPARDLFATLGVFAGPFDDAAASAVHHRDEVAAGAMLLRLEELCDHSLLEVAPGGTPQFRLLETVREYALARLAETGRHEETFRRHLDHYLAVAGAAVPPSPGPAQPDWLDELESAYPNIRGAFDFARRQADADCLDAGLRLAITLVPLWHQRLSLAEGAWQLDRLLADGDVQPTSDVTRARALVELAVLECFRGDYRRSVELAEPALALGHRIGDRHATGRAQRVLGEAALAVGDHETAEAHFSEQLAEAQRTGDPMEQGAAYNMLGQVARHRRHYAEAVRLLHHGLRWFGNAGGHDPVAVGAVLNSLGEVARDIGDARRATRLFAAALHRHWQWGTARGMAYDLEGLAAAAALRGEGVPALHYLGAAQVLRERTGGPLPPVEQAIVNELLEPAVSHLTAEQRHRAVAEGRRRPLTETIDEALTHSRLALGR